MNTDLGFDARPESVQSVNLGRGAKAPPPSDTVLDVDRWGRRRARDIAQRWSAGEVGEYSAEVVADAHEALFAPEPQAAERPADPARAAWWAQLMETPEYRALHQQTCLDPMLSELAAAQVCAEWASYATQEPEPQAGQDNGQPQPGSDDEPIGNTIARMRSTARALQQAQDQVDTAQATSAGLGMGEGSTLAPEEVAKYFKRVRDNKTLRAIMDMAGRMRALSSALQRAKTRHGRDDVVGIELGGDISRLVPSELLQLCSGIPELELLALHRVATRRAMCREYRGTEKAAQGPIVVSVDESGSMYGDRIVAAKGLALALAWLAHHQHRYIMLAGFSGGAEATRYIAAPGRHDQDALLSWLEHMWNGGTTLEAPLQTVPSWWSEVPSGKTDHIIITDAEVDLPDALRDSYRAWAKTEQVRTYGIVIGRRDPGSLWSQVCDRVWALPSLDLDAAAVQEVLSL